MSEEVLEMVAGVRARLYVASEEEVKLVAKHLVPKFETDSATRAKTLSVIEEYIGTLGKEADGGVSILKEISKLLDKTEKIVTSTKESTGEPTTKGPFMFRKDFKLSGQIGDLRTGLSFTSYVRQVNTGVTQGYPEKEVIEAVIRAIQPGNRLRSYLESRDGLDLETLNALIRSYYQEQIPTELYQQMCGLSQASKESPQEFIFRALDTRQKVLFASKSAELSYDPVLVQQMFLRSLSTGLRDDLMGAEFNATLSMKSVTDEQLVKAINSITVREAERHAKIDISKKVSKVLQLEDTTRVSPDPVIKEPKPGKFQLELQELKTEVASLRQQMTNQRSDRTTSNARNTNTRARACQNCLASGQRCNHCFKCGSDEHWQRGCRAGKSNNIANSGN
ncbi:MAG: hypothetical protein ABW185_02755 [Sedimenticola sp.]